jgi:hypothetical protein
LGRTRFNAFNFKSDPVRPEHWRYAPLFTLLMWIVETFSTVHVNSGEWFLHARNSKRAAFLPLHFKRKKQCDPWTINDFLIVTKLLFHVVCMETNREHVRMFGLSLFTGKHACFVPHDYKKSPSDLSLTFRFWVPIKFPLSFHKFVLLVFRYLNQIR